jgi:nucleotide-binding universal stress UspA family protein
MEPAMLGLDAAKLGAAVDLDTSTSSSQAVLVVRHGYIAAEKYFGTFGASSQHESFSMAKSFSSALIGIAIEQGLLSGTDEKLCTYYPDDWDCADTADPRSRITIEHAMNVSTGLRWSENWRSDATGTNDAYNFNLLSTALGREAVEEPGTRMRYSTGDPALLSGVLQGATGMSAPAVIVVDSALGAAEARRLVDKLDRPVLIARDARPNGELLAASDMSDAQFPVLARARCYARALERDITFFHNAKPMSVFVADPMSGGTSYASMLQMQEDVAAAKSAQLRNLAKTGRHAAAFVARAANTIDALLDLATERDADVIVVGHRPRSGIRRLLGRSTAERVIGRSGRSVLVVPVDRAV